MGGGFYDPSVFPIQKIIHNWEQYNSPDYFCGASPYQTTGTPLNIFGNQYAKQSNSYVGISVYQGITSEYKEYFYQQLSTPLIAGKTYCASFWVSRADRKEYAIKQIGACFSTTLLPMAGGNQYINATPQVVNTTGFLTDTIKWTEVQGCFVANGGEQYITIGNFNNNANTDTLYVGTTNPIAGDTPYAYYYIDSVSLWEDTNVGIKPMPDVLEGGAFNLYPNPAANKLQVQCVKLVTEPNEAKEEALSLKIIDVLGREVLHTVFKTEIDMSELQQGVYFISILNKNKIIGTKKIIKQ